MFSIPGLPGLPVIGDLLKNVIDGNTVINPSNAPVPSPPVVEEKVKAAVSATAVTGGAMGLLAPLIAKLPPMARVLAMAALPVLLTALAAYLAPHTARS